MTGLLGEEPPLVLLSGGEPSATALPAPILIVDDRADARVAMRAILTRPDYRIVEAASGPEALRRLLDQEFAVLLLDVRMPEMSGIEVARIVRRRERTRAVPIVFLTASETSADVTVNAYEAGAVDYLVKPVVPELVRAKVSVFVELYRQRKRIEEQAALLVDAERKESELGLLGLRLSTARSYRNLADAIPNIVWTAQRDGSVDYYNRQWFAYGGISAEQAAGRWDVLVHPDDRPDCATGWARAVESGAAFQAECRLRKADGTFRAHLCRAVPERGSTGEIVSWIGSFTDIDEQRRIMAERESAQAERDALYHKALEAIRARDEFLSIASHELRTPLTSLHLAVETLLRASGNRDHPPSREQLAAKLLLAQRQVDRLARLIDELLDVARIETGQLHLEREELDLLAVAREIASRLGEDAKRAGCSLRVRGDAPVVGNWDRLRMEQVVTNLIANAMKFGSGKPIEIEVSTEGEAGRLSVRDQGIGIPPEDLERIFQRFERAVPSRSYGGLGLGLYIVRQIVEAHGGTIRASSPPGEGATLTVDLPKADTSFAAAGQAPPVPLGGG